MKKLILFVLIIMTNSHLLPQDILINQAGYRPSFPKYVFVNKPAEKFFINDAKTGKVVFNGNLKLWKESDPATGMNIYKGDFSSFKGTGTFYISTGKTDTSYRFDITENVYNDVYNKTLKSYYLQRCGTALLQEYAGPYVHPECHMTDGVYHSTAGLSGSKVVTGGWHDAGDYGKYVVNAGITVGTLLMAYEMFPEKFSQDDLNIPESGNKVPDILDEVKFELDWLFTMQDTSGGVFAKVTRKNFEGFVMPQEDKAQRFIYQVTSAATGDFAAVMARAYRNYRSFDPAYADKCLMAAENAWKFLENHPGIVPAGGFNNPSDTQTGNYGDANDMDERIWAAAELYITTGNEKYNIYYCGNYKVRGIFKEPMGWPEVASMAHLTYLFGKQSGKNSSVTKEISKGLIGYCDQLVNKKNQEGLHILLDKEDYVWGSNAIALNKAVLLVAGYTITKDKNFFETALDQLNFVLGVNPQKMSYITGIGSKSPMNPHHRPSGSDGIVNPVPGLVIGGPNKNIFNDYVLSKHFNESTPPALCYLDELASYSSNETCINWNAPLVFLAGYFNKVK